METNKYNNGKIYKIVSNTTDLVYYGSTCERLSMRLARHRKSYNEYKKEKYPYMTSFDVLETGSYDIVLVEDCPCNSKEQLHRKEREYIENNPCVNRVIPTRSKKEWRDDNKKQIKLNKQAYYERNKDDINDLKRQHYEQNSEEIKQKAKIYRDQNQQKIKDKKRENYEKHKETILNKMKDKMLCECGSTISIGNKYDHLKSRKHLSFISNKTAL